MASKKGRITYIRKRKFPDGEEDKDEKQLTTMDDLRPDDTNADSATIISASLDDFMTDVPRQNYWGSPYQKFAENFKMPRPFHRVVTMGISSVFNTYEQFENEDDPKDKSISFTLRFKIKLFAKGATEPSPIGGSPITKVDYTWGTSTVFIKVEKKDDGPLRSIIFMVDPPPYLVKKVQTATTRQLVNPFFIYSIMVSDATQRFEKSIWELRDVIRDQEKNRPAAKVDKPDNALYPHLHDLTRHVIHSTEACDSALSTLEELISVMKDFIDDYKQDHVSTHMIPDEILTRKAYNIIRNERVYLKSLRLRSQTLYERLKNEINLTFNMATQFDSSVSVAIGTATREDSRTMTFIGLLTMFFLPATAVATIYGANFLPLNEETGRISPASKDNALFWAISISLTVLIGFAWGANKVWAKHQSQDFASAIPNVKTPKKASSDSDEEGNPREKGLKPIGARIGTLWTNTTKKRGSRDAVAFTETVADIESGPRP